MSIVMTAIPAAVDNVPSLVIWHRAFSQLYKLHPHGSGCSTPAELLAKISEHYWNTRTSGIHKYKTEDNFRRQYYRDICKLRVAYDGRTPVAAYAVLGDELIGLISIVPGLGSWLLQHAQDDGAKRLDTFEGNPLERLLGTQWEVTVKRPNWVSGKPAVHYYKRVG